MVLRCICMCCIVLYLLACPHRMLGVWAKVLTDNSLLTQDALRYQIISCSIESDNDGSVRFFLLSVLVVLQTLPTAHARRDALCVARRSPSTWGPLTRILRTAHRGHFHLQQPTQRTRGLLV